MNLEVSSRKSDLVLVSAGRGPSFRLRPSALAWRVVAALSTPEARTALLAQGAEASPTSPEDFDRYVKAEIAKWGKVIKAAGMQSN